jgi:hypothetical protein
MLDRSRGSFLWALVIIFSILALMSTPLGVTVVTDGGSASIDGMTIA